MTNNQKEFIETIGNIAGYNYLKLNKKGILPSVCIAQAILESGWNLNAKTLFGIKGYGINLPTTEYINGVKVNVIDSFKSYPNIASSVEGYYNFLNSTPRYSKAVAATNYIDAIDGLINTTDGKPYATDPCYIDKLITLIRQYSLFNYDSFEEKNNNEEKINNDIILSIFNGDFGNGQERIYNLSKVVKNPALYQQKVNEIYKIATGVINGKYGNGHERKEKLSKNGYDYNLIQKVVNILLN